MRLALLCAAAVALAPAQVRSEPVGRWWSGWGQGTTEYGIKNDSAGSDAIYIACAHDTTYVSFTVAGKNPSPGSRVIVTIEPDEYEFLATRDGYLGTLNHVEADTFYALWSSLRRGTAARVRLASGESTIFSLKGSSKVLDKEACTPDFAR